MSRFRRGLLPLTIANVKSYYRNRAALFWTLAFPVIFIVLFGSIFSGGPTHFSRRLGRPGPDRRHRPAARRALPVSRCLT